MAARARMASVPGLAGAEAGPSALGARRLALAALGVGLLYAVLVELIGLSHTFGQDAGTVVFRPAAGVTVSLFVLRPQREWPAFLAAIFAAAGITNALDGAGVWTSIGYGAANALEPAVSAMLVWRWLHGMPDLSRQRDLGVFVVAAAWIGPAVGAAIGTIWPGLLGEASLWPRLGRWYLADAVGVLVIAPLIISVALPPARPLFKLSQSWTFALLGLAIVALMGADWTANLALQFKFVLIPVLALIGMRMGPGRPPRACSRSPR